MIALTQTDALMPRLEFYGYPDGWPKFGGYHLERATIFGLIPMMGFTPLVMGDDIVQAQLWQICAEVEIWVLETKRHTYRVARSSENYILEAIRHRFEKQDPPKQLALLPVGA